MATSFYGSSLGKKAVMAVTGIILFGFVVSHMVGNLKMYQGPESYNTYASALREIGDPFFPNTALLWVARSVLLLAVVLHIVAAWQVSRRSLASRRRRYARHAYVQADYAARTMRWGGVIIALFVLYHLAHFTWGFSWAHPDFVHGDVYHNVVAGFRSPVVSLFYIVANLALGLHLYHGLWSLFQTLGWSQGRASDWRRHFASVFAFIVTAGNVSFPIAVLTGIVA